MRKSLMGFTLLPEFDPASLEMLLNARPRVGVVLESELDRLPAVVDAVDVPIYRVMYRDGHYDGYDLAEWISWSFLKPNEFGIRLADVAEQARSQGKTLYIWGPNEPDTSNLDLIQTYAAFEAGRTQYVREAWGARAVVGNFGRGQGDADVIEAFGAALTAIAIYGGAVGFHEYGYLVPWCYMGLNQRDADINLDPFPAEEITPAWFMGRYRATLQEDLPVIITEYGHSDSLPDDPALPRRNNGEMFGAWNTCVGRWDQLFGPKSDAEHYMAMLAWADAYYQQDPRVLGVAQFGLGGSWPEHDIDKTVGAQAAYIVAQGDIAEEPPGGNGGNGEEPPSPPPDVSEIQAKAIALLASQQTMRNVLDEAMFERERQDVLLNELLDLLDAYLEAEAQELSDLLDL